MTSSVSIPPEISSLGINATRHREYSVRAIIFFLSIHLSSPVYSDSPLPPPPHCNLPAARLLAKKICLYVTLKTAGVMLHKIATRRSVQVFMGIRISLYFRILALSFNFKSYSKVKNSKRFIFLPKLVLLIFFLLTIFFALCLQQSSWIFFYFEFIYNDEPSQRTKTICESACQF